MRHRKKLAAAVIAAGLLAVFGSTFFAAPLPAVAPYDGPLPSSSPPAMSIHGIVTGTTHRSAAIAYRGGSFRDARDFSMSAVLVRHPRGDILIDTGLGSQIDRQLELMPWWFRATTSWTKGRSAADQLADAGWDRS